MTVAYSLPEALDFEAVAPRILRNSAGQGRVRTSTVETERLITRDWRPHVLRALADALERGPDAIDLETARSVAEWVIRLPPILPAPFFDSGDDGSIGLEWDVDDCHFHVSFYRHESEGHFYTDSGVDDEYDDLLKYGSAVRRSLTRLMSATLGG